MISSLEYSDKNSFFREKIRFDVFLNKCELLCIIFFIKVVFPIPILPIIKILRFCFFPSYFLYQTL